jgi:hypothetical protein
MSEKLTDIWKDPAEAVGELFLEKQIGTFSPALAQMPLLSTVIAAYKSIGAISDYMLARKVQEFYTAWGQLEKLERQKIYKKFQKKPKAFSEKLLGLLAQQEDLEKCRLIGVLTTAYLQDNVKRGDYFDMIESFSYLSLRDLIQLQKLVERGGVVMLQREIGERYGTLFVGRGFMETEQKLPGEQRVSDEPYYKMTKLGTLLAKHMKAGKIQELKL